MTPEQPMACCPRPGCGAPLILTLAWSRNEFYCLECGGHYGWLDPVAQQPTPELDARYAALKDEWDAHAGGLIGDGVRLQGCPLCRSEPHSAHATEEEERLHGEALAWLGYRVRVT